jgi:hypothetical protein
MYPKYLRLETGPATWYWTPIYSHTGTERNRRVLWQHIRSLQPIIRHSHSQRQNKPEANNASLDLGGHESKTWNLWGYIYSVCIYFLQLKVSILSILKHNFAQPLHSRIQFCSIPDPNARQLVSDFFSQFVAPLQNLYVHTHIVTYMSIQFFTISPQQSHAPYLNECLQRMSPNRLYEIRKCQTQTSSSIEVESLSWSFNLRLALICRFLYYVMLYT